MVDILVPAWWLRGKLLIERTWGWSPIEEALLLELSQREGDFNILAPRLNLPRQTISSAVARLMEFGLVEAKMTDTPSFVASETGQIAIRDGRPLPLTSSERAVSISMILTEIGDTVCRRRDVRTRLRSHRISRSTVVLPPPQDYENPIASDLTDRIGELVTLHPGEWARGMVGGATSIQQVYISVQADKNNISGLPSNASSSLLKVVRDIANQRKPIIPIITTKEKNASSCKFEISFDSSDVILGGEPHLEKFEELISGARRHIFLVSTFVADAESANDPIRFERVCSALEGAVSRGVHCYLFYGSSTDNERKHAAAMKKLYDRLEGHTRRRGFVHCHYDSVNTHAKILVADNGEDGYTSMVGSCNWLQTPFSAVEASIALRDPIANSQVMRTFSRIIAKSGGPDRSIAWLNTLSKECERMQVGLLDSIKRGHKKQKAELSILGTQDHEGIIRFAAHSAKGRFLCGSHRLGSTVVPGALHPAEAAADVAPDVRIAYSRIHKPLHKKHVRKHRERLRTGVEFKPMRSPQMHAKFLIWDTDDIVITSMNWASASARPYDEFGEVGIHIRMPGLASLIVDRLEILLPMLKQEKSPS